MKCDVYRNIEYRACAVEISALVVCYDHRTSWSRVGMSFIM